MGEGYSQYQNESTRIGILQEVKKVCREYLGSVGHAEKGGEHALELIENSISILKLTIGLMTK